LWIVVGGGVGALQRATVGRSLVLPKSAFVRNALDIMKNEVFTSNGKRRGGRVRFSAADIRRFLFP
jgi:hypothetical protein